MLDFISESILNRIQGIELDIPSPHANQAINEVLKGTVLLGGKRLRPLLTYLMGEFLAIPLNELDVCARSVEMVHAASLAHDDVIDQATMRRGAPSINVATSNKKAVLAGDYLLSKVIGDLTRSGNLTLVYEMSEVIADLAEGEWVQWDAAIDRSYSWDIIERIACLKTSSVMRWCCVSPMVIKGLNDEFLQYGKRFGHHLGIAFQLMDDTLDFSGTGQKDHLLDLKNGMVNSVLYLWLEKNPSIKKAYLEGNDVAELWTESGLDYALSEVKERALGHIKNCRELLDILVGELTPKIGAGHLDRTVQPLHTLLDFLEERKF